MTFQVKNPKKIGRDFLAHFTWNHPQAQIQNLHTPKKVITKTCLKDSNSESKLEKYFETEQLNVYYTIRNHDI